MCLLRGSHEYLQTRRHGFMSSTSLPVRLHFSLVFVYICLYQAVQAAYDVVVVGAGAAGLGAASALQVAGFDVVVLESRDRIGGRIYTQSFSSANRVDIGAAWIHGLQGNPLTQIAQNNGFQLQRTDYNDNKLYSTNGQVMPLKLEWLLDQQFDDFLETASRFQNTGVTDTPLQALADRFLTEESVRNFRSFNWTTASNIVHEYAAELSELSAFWWDSDTAFPGADALVVGGYDQIARVLAQDLTIKLREAVQRITYASGKGVTVTTQNGLYRAKHAIVTLPLGVLKAKTVSFGPPLPARVQMAVARLGMGLLNKAILRFDRVFWDRDVQVINYIPTVNGAWVEWLNLAAITGQPVLVGFNAADYARRLEGLSDREVVREAMGVLRTMYGPSVPDPSATLVTRWGSDPWSKGSYSYNALGSSPADRRVLGGALGGGTLFLAGEHVSVSRWGTVHGALMSGRAQAQAVLRQLRG